MTGGGVCAGIFPSPGKGTGGCVCVSVASYSKAWREFLKHSIPMAKNKDLCVAEFICPSWRLQRGDEGGDTSHIMSPVKPPRAFRTDLQADYALKLLCLGMGMECFSLITGEEHKNKWMCPHNALVAGTPDARKLGYTFVIVSRCVPQKDSGQRGCQAAAFSFREAMHANSPTVPLEVRQYLS